MAMAGQATIEALVSELENKDGIARQKARESLVQIGLPALDPLVHIFETKRKAYAHWEAAKAISAIGGPHAVPPLLRALDDDDFSVRWIAAEGLVAIGRPALEAILQALVSGEFEKFFCEGVHHVFHDLMSKKMIDDEIIKRIAPLQQMLAKAVSSRRVSQQAGEIMAWLQSQT